MILRWTALPLTLLAAACGQASSDDVGGLTAGEASALNEAARELDARTGATLSNDSGFNPAAVAAARADRGRRPQSDNAAP